jgi:hypothetical protein
MMSLARDLNGALDYALDDASKLVSFAQALEDEHKRKPAMRVWGDAGHAEEIVACLLEGADRDAEAALHRVSAATCYEKAQVFTHAVTLLKAASAAATSPRLQRIIAKQLRRCLRKANADL